MLKQKIYDQCSKIMLEKVMGLQKRLLDLSESASNETKSTAGDKHETALAMLQIEQASIRAQLKQTQAQQAVLLKIDPSVKSNSIRNGSLVKTNQGYLFISVALGKVELENDFFIALSTQSPLGAKLIGLQAGQQATINQLTYHIESVE
jgi:transcription elongation GreA/GreB family factor